MKGQVKGQRLKPRSRPQALQARQVLVWQQEGASWDQEENKTQRPGPRAVRIFFDLSPFYL
jgi:hypothetical protein